MWCTNAVNQAVMLWHRGGATPAQIFAFYYGVPSPGPDVAWAALSRCTNGERAAAWAAAFAARRACFVHVPRCAGTSVEAAVFGLPFFSQHLSAAQLSRLLGGGGEEGGLVGRLPLGACLLEGGECRGAVAVPPLGLELLGQVAHGAGRGEGVEEEELDGEDEVLEQRLPGEGEVREGALALLIVRRPEGREM